MCSTNRERWNVKKEYRMNISKKFLVNTQGNYTCKAWWGEGEELFL
jgi:hypothetical protein